MADPRSGNPSEGVVCQGCAQYVSQDVPRSAKPRREQQGQQLRAVPHLGECHSRDRNEESFQEELRAERGQPAFGKPSDSKVFRNALKLFDQVSDLFVPRLPSNYPIPLDRIYESAYDRGQLHGVGGVLHWTVAVEEAIGAAPRAADSRLDNALPRLGAIPPRAGSPSESKPYSDSDFLPNSSVDEPKRRPIGQACTALPRGVCHGLGSFSLAGGSPLGLASRSGRRTRGYALSLAAQCGNGPPRGEMVGNCSMPSPRGTRRAGPTQDWKRMTIGLPPAALDLGVTVALGAIIGFE